MSKEDHDSSEIHQQDTPFENKACCMLLLRTVYSRDTISFQHEVYLISREEYITLSRRTKKRMNSYRK